MREMKDSKFDIVGKIPCCWDVRRMKYFCTVETGDQDTQDADPDGTFPFYVRSPIIEKSNLYTFSGDGILMAGDGAGAGRIFHYATGKYAVHQRVYRLAHIKDIASRFLFYYISSIFPQVMDKGSAQSTVPSVRLPMLKNLQVCFPDDKEQQDIVQFLDRKCAEIEKLTADIQSEIETLEKYRTSCIAELVIHGSNTSVEQKDSKIRWIGNIPKHWRTLRLANIYRDVNESGNSNLPILTVSINAGVSDRELSDDESLRAFVRSEDKSKYKTVRPNDLVYNTMRAWQGAIGAVQVRGMVSPAYVVMRPFQEVDSRYVGHLLRTPQGTEEIRRYSYGIADFRLRFYWYASRILQICLPPIEEQHSICDLIDAKNTEIDSLISEKQNQIDSLAEYKKSLIYEYVTGKKEVPHE